MFQPAELADLLRCLRPIPPPDAAGAPSFSGSNVSDFIQKWEATSRRHGRAPEDADLIAEIPNYCIAYILKEDIEILAGYDARDWTLLKSSMLKAFRALDDKARTYTQPFFNTYIRDWNGGQDEASDSDLRNFVSRYISIALQLKLKNAIDDYEIVHVFLDGLPRAGAHVL
jgi:hypothetical protein